MKHPGDPQGPETHKGAAYEALDRAEHMAQAAATTIGVRCAAAITYGLLAIAQELREANTLARKARR